MKIDTEGLLGPTEPQAASVLHILYSVGYMSKLATFTGSSQKWTFLEPQYPSAIAPGVAICN